MCGRALVVQRGVTASPIVKHLDVVKQIALGVFPREVALVEHPFVLQAVEEALHRRVVPAVALATHGAGHSVLGEFGLERMASVLAAPIGVNG